MAATFVAALFDWRIDMSMDEVNALLRKMHEMEAEAQRALSAQRMAAGDDTHYFRRSLVDFCAWSHGCDESKAREHVNEYLNDKKGQHFPRRFMRRARKLLSTTT